MDDPMMNYEQCNICGQYTDGTCCTNKDEIIIELKIQIKELVNRINYLNKKIKAIEQMHPETRHTYYGLD